MQNIREAANNFIKLVNELEISQASAIKTKSDLEAKIIKIMAENEHNREALDIATHAIEILRGVSDEAVAKAYKFLENSLNAALDRMFQDSTRRIRIEETTRNNQYPQLELVLTVGNGNQRKIKTDSGHGIAQIISLLSILSLIVITNSRRIMVMDEVLSGLSVAKLQIVTDIMWTFTDIGFQFIVNEHGYIPRGAAVYHFGTENDVAKIIDTYVEQEGVYYGASDENATIAYYDKALEKHIAIDDLESVEVEEGSDADTASLAGDGILSL